MVSSDLLAEVDLSKAIARNPLTLSSDRKVAEAISLISAARKSCSLTSELYSEQERNLVEAQSSCILVIDDNQLVGILTEGDLIDLIATKQALTDISLSEVMTNPVVTLKDSDITSLFAILEVFQKYQIRHLPIIDKEENLLGLLTYKSLRYLSDPINLLRLHQISEVMNSEIVHAKPTTSVAVVTHMMSQQRVSSVAIVEESELQATQNLHPIGIITEQDLVCLLTLELDLEKIQAQKVMNSSLVSVRPNASLWSVQMLMQQRQINQVIVINHQNNLLGIVTQSDLLRVFNPSKIYRTLGKLTKQVSQLEIEKLDLLKNRTAELEKQVKERTAELQTQYQKERLLADITSQIRASLNLKDVLNTTVETIRSWLNCDRVLLYQFEKNKTGKVIVESVSRVDLSILNQQIKDPCLSSKWDNGNTFNQISSIEDLTTSTILACHKEMLASLQVRANLVVPVFQNFKLWGLLIAHQCDKPRSWQNLEIELLKQIANQFAIALQQAAAYEQAQNELEERKRAEQALRESEQKLKLAFEAANMGSWNWNIQTNKLQWSKNLESLFGLLPGEFDGSYEMFVTSIHPEDRARVLKAIDYSITTGTEYNIEFRIVYPNGTIRWALGKGKVFYDADGQPLQMAGIDLDITERKTLENQLFQINQELERRIEERTADLQQSEARLREAQQIARMGNWEFDLITKKITWSSEIFEIFGLNPGSKEPNYEELNQYIDPESRQSCDFLVKKSITEAEPYQADLKIIRQDGSLGYIFFKGEAVCNPEGRVVRLFGIAMDITERKQVEAELQKVSSRLQLAIKASGSGIWELDLIDNQVIWDRGMYQLFGITPSEGLDLKQIWENSLHPEDRNRILQDLADGLQNSQELFNEYRIIRSNGSVRFLEASALIERNQSGQPQRAIGINYDISERKQAEAALAQYTQEVEDLYNNAPCGYHSLDAEGRFVKVNNTQLKLLGYTREEMVGKSFVEFVNENSREIFLENFPLFKQQGWLKDLELEIICKDGTIVPVMLNASAVKDLDGKFLQSRSTLFDLSDLKQTQIALQESEHRYATLTEISPVGIFQIDPEGNCLYVNERWCQITGIDAEQAMGQGWVKAIYFEDRQKVAKAWYHAVKEKKAFKLEYRFQHNDNKIVWVFGQETATYDLEGKVVAYVGTVTDISDRKQKEGIIRLQAKREFVLRSITQKIRQSFDLNLIFNTVCREVRQFINADRVGIFQFYPDANFEDGEFIAEALIQSFPSALDTKIHDRCFGEQYAAYYQQGKAQVVDDIDKADLTDCHRQILAQFQIRANLIIPLLQGKNLWGLICVHQCSQPRHWQHFEVNFIRQIANQLAIAIQQADLFKQLQTELNERKQAEIKLQQINQQLELNNQELSRATRLKDEFLANMSHELRTPLNTILGMSEALQEEVFGPLSEKQQQTITAIESSGKHLLELIEDILDLAKIEAGKLELNLSSVCVQELCQASLVFIKHQAIKKRLQIEINIPSNLGEIQVDRRRMRQVLINLLSNAVKFTSSEGKIVLKVIIETTPLSLNAQTNRLICFSVIDTGIGIAAENINKLFQPFTQIDSALNRQYSGTGLGLTLVKQIVEMHGGFIQVNSKVDRGSCFKVCLPYHCQVTNPINRSSKTHTNQFSSKLLLIVENSQTDSRQLLRYLKSFGLKAIVHKQGEGIIEKILEIQPQVIFLELIFSNRSSWETLNQLKTHPETKDIAIVLVSAIDQRSHNFQLGDFETLVKPVTKEKLQAVLAKISNLTTVIPTPTTQKQRPLILLAEDNQANVETFSDYLENRGYQIILANNGQEAIALTLAQTPDLIIMDLQMPILDGFEAILRLRNDWQCSSIPIIALTALAMAEDREKCLKIGANQYLTKPVRLQQLAKTIEQLLNKS